ncbi:CsiV family protein [Congregibacter brevis]|uniref:CsiV family protein n=1 Tax=Congregibacter brevis TaxID=3081201 RepID=A0ABZ0IAA8_9GAMM|nr:CsiV family protein [Congregibacter sp. IMCC45268]
MKRPNNFLASFRLAPDSLSGSAPGNLLSTLFGAAVSAFFSVSASAEVPDELAENWYRTEILIFVREDAESRRSEQWEPLPELNYPERYQYLIDPAMADRRLQESLGYESIVDGRGRQALRVPAPIEEVLDHSRPDAITVPLPEPDVLLPADEATIALTVDPNNPNLDPNEPPIDLESPIVSLPYELLSRDSLEFRTQARSLRRRGERVVFHGSWWAQLNEQDETPSLIIDRSGDMDSTDWPALQGSLKVYRSRYLHLVLDLWLNTLGEYLPEGWQIDTPPLSPASLVVRTLSGKNIDPWTPATVVLPGEASLGQTVDNSTDVSTDNETLDEAITDAATELEDEEAIPSYPWRHAIVHRQTRRMRSGETHYLDHPVIGVIVKVTPMSDEALPLVTSDMREFRERHALPVEILQVEPEAEDEND